MTRLHLPMVTIAAALDAGMRISEVARLYGTTDQTIYRRLAERDDPEMDDPMPFDDRPWTDQALCAQTDPEQFYPEPAAGRRSTREAKAVCRRCDVRAECLEYALANREPFGIWGGLSVRERRRLLKGTA